MSVQKERTVSDEARNKRTDQKRPRRDPDEENLKRPVNTIFFFNLEYNLDDKIFKEHVEQFGPIQNICNHIKNKGQAFVTYYNLRDAIKARDSSYGIKIGNSTRPMNAKYAHPKKSNRKGSPSAHIAFKITNGRAEIEEVKSFCKECYGEVFDVKDMSTDGASDEFNVRFYDIRDAEKAVASDGSNNVINGMKYSVSYFYPEEIEFDSDKSKSVGNVNNRRDKTKGKIGGPQGGQPQQSPQSIQVPPQVQAPMYYYPYPPYSFPPQMFYPMNVSSGENFSMPPQDQFMLQNPMLPMMPVQTPMMGFGVPPHNLNQGQVQASVNDNPKHSADQQANQPAPLIKPDIDTKTMYNLLFNDV